MYFTWMAQQERLSAGALTLRAQSVSPNDTGRLLWDVFFPRVDADSVKIASISNVDFRPATDRREWNQRGRLVDLRAPEAEELEMVPIEGYFQVAEREMQHMLERTLGNEALFQQIVGNQVPERVDSLALGNFRRLELDAFTAWALGQITVRNPQTGATYTFSLGFDAARYQQAATAWSAGSENAWDNFIAWLEESQDLMGAMPAGVMLRLADLKTIQADAPDFYSPSGTNAITREQFRQAVEQTIGGPFTFYVNEQSIDVYGDAGTGVARTKVWPAGVLAAVPQGGQVGSSHFAPVARAFDISRAQPDAQVDIRGQTAYWETFNGGRALNVEVQMNALPLPNEQLVSVIDIVP